MADNFEHSMTKEIVLSTSSRCLLVKWKVATNQKVPKGSILAVYKICSGLFHESDLILLPKLKSDIGGRVNKLLVGEGEEVQPGQPVILIDVCEHKTIMKDMCAECGVDLRSEPGIPGNLREPVSAKVALVHNIPELRVSQEEAEVLAKKDKEALLQNRKLVLLVDLDQTLIHTTTENVPPDMKDVYHFQLYGQDCWYHTKFRPGWRTFLEDMSKYYELHIFTMGSRMYAHTIARMLDPTGELFADRIRSRDESFDMFSKYRDLSALFPCDDSMVCIIDDREDIWDCAPNLVTVKPYRFFEGTDDINAPPGSNQAFTHPSAIPLHESASNKEMKKEDDNGITEIINEKVANEAKLNDEKHDGESDPADRISTDTTTTQFVPENVDRDGISESAVKNTTVTKVNHLVMEIPDMTKPNSKVTNAGKHGICDKSEAVLDISSTEPLRNESEIFSEGTESRVSGETQEKNETEKEEVNKGQNCERKMDAKSIGEEKMATDTAGEKVGEKNDLQEDSEVRECRVNETGGSESEVPKNCGNANTMNHKHDMKTSDVEYQVEDNDDYLLYLKEILRRIHQRFYEVFAQYEKAKSHADRCDALADRRTENPPDLRCIMPELRCSVLQGTKVVFTGVIPTNCRHEESQAWKIATQFGASVSRDLLTRKNTTDKSKRTSHVIAARPGTEKAYQASRLPNVKLVNPDWLWTCAERWEWVDERLFPVEDYEEYKSRRNETAPSSRRATPKGQLQNDGSSNDVDSSQNNFVEVQRNFQKSGDTSSSDSFKEVVNPFLNFSSGEMEAMDKEVEDLMRSSEGEDGNEEEDRDILGSVSSSSSTENGRNSSASDASSRTEGELNSVELENRYGNLPRITKGTSVKFTTITQTLERQGGPKAFSKRRKLDFCEDVQSPVKKVKRDDCVNINTDADFGTCSDESNGSVSTEEDDDEDGDGNDMAALLEAAIYHT